MRLHRLRTVFSGVVIYPMESVSAAKMILGRWTEYMGASVRKELSTSAKLGCDTSGQPLVMLSFCYAGPEVGFDFPFFGLRMQRPHGLRESHETVFQYYPVSSHFAYRATRQRTPQEEGKALVHPFMSSLPYVPVMNSLRTRDYIQQQRNTTQYLPAAGYRYGIRGQHLAFLTSEVIESLAESILRVHSDARRSVIDITLLGGAVSEVGEDATAWVHRKAGYEVTLIGTWEEAEQDVENKRWLDEVRGCSRGGRTFVFGPASGLIGQICIPTFF